MDDLIKIKVRKKNRRTRLKDKRAKREIKRFYDKYCRARGSNSKRHKRTKHKAYLIIDGILYQLCR